MLARASFVGWVRTPKAEDFIVATPSLAPAYAAFGALTASLSISVVATDFSADVSLYVGLVQIFLLLGIAALLARLGRTQIALGIETFALITATSAVVSLFKLRIFTLAWLLSLCVTIAIWPFTPAQDTYLYHGVTHQNVPHVLLPVAWNHIEVLDAVRAGGMRELSTDTMFGVITFPSFHAAGAFLLGWGFWWARWLRWPFLALNAALAISAVFVGGHFLIDIVAGCAIAAASIVLAGRLLSAASNCSLPINERTAREPLRI